MPGVDDLLAEGHEDLPKDLASSLNNLGGVLSYLGRRDEALAATQEAVSLRRTLALGNPDAFLPDLAGSLNNLGDGLNDLGRREEALTIALEALDVLWPLFERLPQAFAQRMSMTLRNLARFHTSLDRPLSPVLQDRIAIFQRLAGS